MATTLHEPLTGEELTTWHSYLTATRLLLNQIDDGLTKAANLSHVDFGLLVRLAEAPPEGLRMSDLADKAVFSRSRITHAVDRLEKRGLVERTSCPTDRRGSYAVLTEKGREQLAEAQPIHAELVRTHLLQLLTADQMDTLRQITEAVGRSLGASSDQLAC